MENKEIKIIKLNKIKCKKCGSILESKDINDFKRCSCGAVAIDGGYEYLKRIGNIIDYEDYLNMLLVIFRVKNNESKL